MAKTKTEKRNLNDLLEDIDVMPPGMWENDDGPKGWFAVANDEGVTAYFCKEADAFRFRLDLINRILNP